MNIFKDQRGVALAVEIILVAVVLSLVGLAVYTESKAKPVAQVATSSTPTPSPTPSPTTSPSPTPAFFAMAQWGVRAPYSGTDKFNYTIVNDTWGSLATIISNQLATKYPADCATYGAGQIKRLLPTTIASQALATDSKLTVAQFAKQNPALGLKLVGNYYYMFMHDDAVCSTKGVADQNQANDVVKGLVANFELSQ